MTPEQLTALQAKNWAAVRLFTAALLLGLALGVLGAAFLAWLLGMYKAAQP